MSDKTKDDAMKRDSNESRASSVETAGETTAADTVSGPDHQRPVGADTMVRVADTPPEEEEHADTTRDS